MPSSKCIPGMVMISLPVRPRRSLHHFVHALNQNPPLQDRRPQLCSGESHTLPEPEFCKKPMTLRSHLPVWGLRDFLLVQTQHCAISTSTPPRPPSISYFPLEERASSFHISEVFVFPNLLPCTLHVSRCLPPTTEILLPILRWIS